MGGWVNPARLVITFAPTADGIIEIDGAVQRCSREMRPRA